jgi:hypothetical protein
MILLTNVGSTYDAIPAAKGLGFQDIDFTDVTQLTFRCRWNKVGTGTLSWQLWNETDGSELAVITDAAAAGDNKTGSMTVAPGLTGVKTVRVRVKSTVATDDPTYYGASISVVRA